VSTLVGGFIEATPCKEEGIGAIFSSGANAGYLDASYSEELRGGIYKYGKPCRLSRRCPCYIVYISLRRCIISGVSWLF
jgi:hypothetical protein